MAVVITGASRGIGYECARLFASLSPAHKVIMVSRKPQDAVDRLAKSTTNVVGVECDVADYESVMRMAQQVHDITGDQGPRVLINAAGIAINGVLASTPISAIQQLINTNLLGTIYTCKLLSKQMIAASSRAKQTNQTPALHRSIINVGSILGRTGGAGQSVYSSTKSALTGLSRSLAKELGPRGITVNVVSPGLIETDMTAKLSAEQKQAFVQRSCLRRPGTPAEVASSILFLTESPYITGQTLHVDGGIF